MANNELKREEEYFYPFPVPYRIDNEGLLCTGGNLSPSLLVFAYSRGIFPWYSEDDPILWWCPNPRWILRPEKFHISPRSARKIRNSNFTLSINKDFAQVIRACADTRPDGTWISKDMLEAYMVLHRLGFVHSVETWRNGELVGGLYGVALGKIFFGESMFHRETEASRAALCGLVSMLTRKNFTLIDCQQESTHMIKMGAEAIPRKDFISLVKEGVFGGRDPNSHPSIERELKGEWEYEPENDIWLPL